MKDGYCELHHQTGDWRQRKQCQEDTGFFFGRKNLQGLSSTVYSSEFSKHLLFLCSFNNLGCLISFHTELHKSLIYTWIQSPFQICDLQIFFFSFHRLSFHFTDGFFYYAQGIEFHAVPLVYFCSSCFCFDDWVVWVVYILESNSLTVVLFAVIFSHPYQKTQTGWMDTKIRPIYMLPITDSLQIQSHTHRLQVKGWKKIQAYLILLCFTL